jgi:hypothetical protein
MATYGSGQMLGSGINPESFKQDYSGFTRAAEMQAQGITSLGQNISRAIEGYGEAKKEQKKVDAYNKASAKSIEAAITLGSSYEIAGVEKTLRPFLDAYNDPNLSPIEKAALLDEGKAMIPNVFGRFDQSQANAIQRAQVNARNAPPLPELRTYKREPYKYGSGELQGTQRGSDGQLYDENFNLITNLDAYAKGEAVEVYSSGSGQSAASAIDAGLALPFYGGVGESPLMITGPDGAPMLLPPPEGTTPISPSAIDSSIALDPRQARQVPGEPPASIALPKPIPQLKSRVVSDEVQAVETFRPATAEESAPYGGVPGQMSSTGKFYPIRPTSGTEFTINPDGSTTYRQGAGVGGKAVQAQRAEDAKVDKAMGLMQDLNLLEKASESMTPGVLGAAGRMVAEQIPATQQAETKDIIDRVNSTLTLSGIQEMRANNPTGAALGNVSDKDMSVLRTSVTALRNAQSPAAFKRELVRLKNLQHDLVYGSERVLKSKLDKGEITQSQFSQAMGNAPTEYLDEQGEIKSRSATPSVNPSSGLELTTEERQLIEEFSTKK